MKTSVKVFFIVLIFAFQILDAKPGSAANSVQSQIIDSLNNVASQLIVTNQNTARIMAGKALTLSTGINYDKGKVDALNTLSTLNISDGEYLLALDQYFKICDLYEVQKDTNNLVLTYGKIIQFYLIIKDFDLAEKHLAIFGRTASASKNIAAMGMYYLNSAKYYLAKREIDLAINSAFVALSCFSKSHQKMQEGAVYKFLGDAFVQKKLYTNAEYNYRMAINLVKEDPGPPEIAVLYTRLAHICQVLEKNELNLKYNLDALRIREKLGSPLFIAYSYLNVGEAYWLLNRKDSAGYFLNKSLKLAEQIKKLSLLEAVNQQLSEFAKVENRYEDALRYFTKCIEYRDIMTQEANKADYMILEANRAIHTRETQNDIMNQEVHFQKLQIKKSRLEIILFEVLLIVMFFMIPIVDAVVRKNRTRKNELKELNERLMKEIDIRIEAEKRLKRSEELHRFLAENTVDVISLMDAGLNRIYVSPSCEKFYGYSQQEILHMRSPLELVDPLYHISVNQRLVEMFRSKSSTRYIYKVLRKDGITFWAEANINPIMDPATNEVRNLITVVRNISERMKHEEELSEYARQKEYLLHEIHNRVKNNFAILISLMNMQRDQSYNAELSSSLTDLQLRVRTMSLVHEQLYHNQEISTIPFDNYLHHLTLIISSSFNNPKISLQTDIQPCKVAIEMALPLGLILNELITNAYKYAFPGDKTGTIWVRLTPENDQKFSISICDDGIGLPDDFTMNSTHSMGSQIVGILVEQIEASLNVTSNGGACFRILFSPLQDN